MTNERIVAQAPTRSEIAFEKKLRIFFAAIPLVFLIFYSLFVDEKLNYYLIFCAYFIVSYFLSSLLPNILNSAVLFLLAEYSFGWLATDLYQQLGVLMPNFMTSFGAAIISGHILGKNIGIPRVSTMLKTNRWVYEQKETASK